VFVLPTSIRCGKTTASINDKDVPGDIVGFARAEKDEGVGDLVGGAELPDRDQTYELLAQLRLFLERLARQAGVEDAGSDGVDPDAAAGILLCRLADQVIEGGLADAIVDSPGPRELAHPRAGEQELAANAVRVGRLRQHVRHGRTPQHGAPDYVHAE